MPSLPTTQGGSFGTWGDEVSQWAAVSHNTDGTLKAAAVQTAAALPFVNVTWATYGAVGNGVANDTAAVQAALNDYATGDGRIVIPAGTYLVDNLTVPAGVSHVLGQGGATLKRRASGPLLTVNSSGAVIDGLTLDGQGATFSGGHVVVIGDGITDVRISGCTVTGAAAATYIAVIITGESAHRLTVRDCVIYGQVIANNSDNCLIAGCTFLAPPVAGALFGAVVWSVTAAGKHANGTRIIGNYFEIPDQMFAVVPLSRNGADPPKGTVIANNTFVAVGSSCYGGISVDTCNDATVTGNTFRVEAGSVPQTGALEIVGSSHVTVTGNDFDGGGVVPQVVSINNSSDNILTGNTFRSPATTGVSTTLVQFYAATAGKHCYRNVISNNKFVNPSGGNGMIALVPNNATASVEKTLILGNSFYGNASSRGVKIDSSVGTVTETSVVNNYFATMSQAITLNSSANTFIQGNRFASDVTTRLTNLGTETGIQVSGNDWQMATVVPASQFHFRGERVDNSTPTVGQPTGWMCTVAGTPGTWVALANL